MPEITAPRTPRNYGDLSRALRLDKFDGFTFHQPSLMKETYTQEVFDRRYKDPDEFRHQWDEYGKSMLNNPSTGKLNACELDT